jgi:hypothetical protein
MANMPGIEGKWAIFARQQYCIDKVEMTRTPQSTDRGKTQRE